jgi:hypothetical protein
MMCPGWDSTMENSAATCRSVGSYRLRCSVLQVTLQTLQHAQPVGTRGRRAFLSAAPLRTRFVVGRLLVSHSLLTLEKMVEAFKEHGELTSQSWHQHLICTRISETIAAGATFSNMNLASHLAADIERVLVRPMYNP